MGDSVDETENNYVDCNLIKNTIILESGLKSSKILIFFGQLRLKLGAADRIMLMADLGLSELGNRIGI